MNRNPNRWRGLLASLRATAQAWSAALTAPRGEMETPAGLRLCPIGAPLKNLRPLLRNPRANRCAHSVYPLRLGVGVLLLASLVGCVGYADGGYGGGALIVPGPDFYFFGGGYEHGREIHEYHDRGAHSREVAHPRGRGDRH